MKKRCLILKKKIFHRIVFLFCLSSWERDERKPEVEVLQHNGGSQDGMER